MNEKLIFTDNAGAELDSFISGLTYAGTIVITDTNVEASVLPKFAETSDVVKNSPKIVIPVGDDNKTIDTLASVWKKLSDMEAVRKTIVVNIGGGVVTDLGGFAAATYMRGMRCVNVPTTLLAAVDASVGGKTGINFNGLKNQVGVFSEPVATIISTEFFNTLSDEEILSGYGEMLKHGLLEGDAAIDRLLSLNPLTDTAQLLGTIRDSVEVKARVVAEDLRESGTRKLLNLGHTFGHAFESFSYERGTPAAHGYAVVWGLVCELVLSHMRHGFPSALLYRIRDYVREHYGTFAITCNDYPALIHAMRHDKKNASSDSINCTLLQKPSLGLTDEVVSEDEIKSALDIYRDLML